MFAKSGDWIKEKIYSDGISLWLTEKYNAKAQQNNETISLIKPLDSPSTVQNNKNKNIMMSVITINYLFLKFCHYNLTI